MNLEGKVVLCKKAGIFYQFFPRTLETYQKDKESFSKAGLFLPSEELLNQWLEEVIGIDPSEYVNPLKSVPSAKQGKLKRNKKNETKQVEEKKEEDISIKEIEEQGNEED